MTKAPRIKVPGRGWAYTGAVLGGVSSIAANVAHSFVPPVNAPTGWHPQYGAIAVSMAWPIFLFVVVETLIRVQWPRGWSYHLLRWCGLLPVAIVAAFVSYRHQSGLLSHYGEERIVAVLGPLAIDGMMIMAAGALYAINARIRMIKADLTPTRPVSVPTAATAYVAVPAVTAPVPPTVVEPIPAPATTPVPTPAVVAQRLTPPRTASDPTASATVSTGARTTSPNRASKPAPRPARPAPSTADTSVTASHAAGSKLPVPPALLVKVREVAKDYQREHATPITAGQLAVRLKVTSEQAAQALALLDLAPTTPTRTSINGQPIKANR